MKRLALTFFLLFYAGSVLAMTVQRTEVWASQRAHDLKHARADRGLHVDQAHKRPPRQIQTKLLEDGGSVLVSSFVRSSAPPVAETALYHRMAGFIAGGNAQTVSPRAPPIVL